MKRTTCPECGRAIRPSNMERHRRARHLPRGTLVQYGHKFSVPAISLKIGMEEDRRYDEHVPRGKGFHRFRIYRLRTGELELVATAPYPDAMGVALCQLHGEDEFDIDDSIGVLDTASDPGHWIVSPFTLGRRRPREHREEGP